MKWFYRLYIRNKETGEEFVVKEESWIKKMGLARFIGKLARLYDRKYDGYLMESNDIGALTYFQQKLPGLEFKLIIQP